MELEWDQVSREQWRRLMSLAPRCSLQQDWAYGEAVAAQGHRVRRAVVWQAPDRPVALIQLVERRLVGSFAAVMLMRGPVWIDPALALPLQAPLMSALRAQLGRGVLLWTPETETAGEHWQGLRRVMTGYSTVWLDLRAEVGDLRSRLAAKWRNMLVRAEDAPLTIRSCAGGSLVEWLIAANEAYRRQVGYRGPAPEFIQALGAVPKAGQSRETLVALENGEPVAGVILQQHGRSATYYVGCTSARGRELRAHHLLLWRAIVLLKERGVAAFDLGGVNTVSAPGLARFKLGMGGEVTTLAGTYLATPSSRMA